MIHQIMDVTGLELVENRDSNGTIGEGRKITDSPVGLIAGTNGHLVSFVETALFKCNVKFFNSSGDIAIFKGRSLIIGQRRAVPILSETLFKQFND